MELLTTFALAIAAIIQTHLPARIDLNTFSPAEMRRFSTMTCDGDVLRTGNFFTLRSLSDIGLRVSLTNNTILRLHCVDGSYSYNSAKLFSAATEEHWDEFFISVQNPQQATSLFEAYRESGFDGTITVELPSPRARITQFLVFGLEANFLSTFTEKEGAQTTSGYGGGVIFTSTPDTPDATD